MSCQVSLMKWLLDAGLSLKVMPSIRCWTLQVMPSIGCWTLQVMMSIGCWILQVMPSALTDWLASCYTPPTFVGALIYQSLRMTMTNHHMWSVLYLCFVFWWTHACKPSMHLQSGLIFVITGDYWFATFVPLISNMQFGRKILNANYAYCAPTMSEWWVWDSSQSMIHFLLE